VIGTLITAIVFYFIGRYSHTNEIEQKVIEMKHKLKKKPKAGVIPFKTQEDFEYEKSGDKALDDEWNRPGGIGDLVKS